MATRIVMVLLGLTLTLVIACGTAAPEPTVVPEPTATQAADTAPAGEPTPVPVAGETPQPTTTPQPAAVPAEIEIHSGPLTWMVADWGTERFDSLYGGTINQYARLMHGYLIAANEAGEMIPGIATDWGVSEDGLTWIVNIRDGVKFHDGSPLTAADVAWIWKRDFGPKSIPHSNTATGLSQARVTDKIEQTGPNQVSITMTQVDSSFPVGMLAEAGPNAIGHVLPARDELFNEEAALAYDNDPVGAGPLDLVDHVAVSSMTFERFDDFYFQPANGLPEDRRVNIESWVLALVPEEATRVAALRAGEGDIAPVSLATREQVEAGGGRLVFGPEGIYLRPMFDGCWEDPSFPCHNIKVRQALDLAINKKIIQNELYGGPEVFQVKGWAAVTPGALGYSPELDPWPQDVERARQLLAEAGYPGGEGFGTLVVNTWASAALPFLPEGAQLAKHFWETELGIDVEVRVGDEASIKEARLAGQLSGQITWRDNEARMDGASIMRSSYGTPELQTRFHNKPELFKMVKTTLAVIDQEKRGQAFNELYLRLRDETYVMGIGYANIPWAVSSRVKTWDPFRFSFFPSGMHTITLN